MKKILKDLLKKIIWYIILILMSPLWVVAVTLDAISDLLRFSKKLLKNTKE